MIGLLGDKIERQRRLPSLANEPSNPFLRAAETTPDFELAVLVRLWYYIGVLLIYLCTIRRFDYVNF